MRVQRVRDIQVVFILAEPTKGLPVGDDFKVRSIDVVLLEDLEFFVPEVATYDSNDANIGKETGRDREMRGRAPQHLFAFAKRSFDRIKRDRTNYE